VSAKTKVKSRRSVARRAIHPALKARLGYSVDESNAEVLRDWRARLRRVCKPCWELKYCPYGPLVEQSATIPTLLSDAVAHNDYFKRCLETNLVGSVDTLSPDRRAQYAAWMNDEQILMQQAHFRLTQSQRLAEANTHATDEEKIASWMGGPLPPIHIYRTSYDDENTDIVASDFSAGEWAELSKIASQIKEEYRAALETGILDHRTALEPARAAWFRKQVEEFDSSKYPDAVPEMFYDAQCNVYGHVCPVFFAAEASTETATERRRDRYIPFDVKMRVVRRDNYTCQHCGKHLIDNEVEFDHKIPIAKGGSSEEHNVRLTCFKCNRDKSDKYVP
jgi:HNH endonuclease